jgi:hypothetical protein
MIVVLPTLSVMPLSNNNNNSIVINNTVTVDSVNVADSAVGLALGQNERSVQE